MRNLTISYNLGLGLIISGILFGIFFYGKKEMPKAGLCYKYTDGILKITKVEDEVYYFQYSRFDKNEVNRDYVFLFKGVEIPCVNYEIEVMKKQIIKIQNDIEVQNLLFKDFKIKIER